jgi:hypothetical protein
VAALPQYRCIGVILLGMAFRVAAKARALLVCKMPIAHKTSNSGKTPACESMVVGVAFAIGNGDLGEASPEV